MGISFLNISFLIIALANIIFIAFVTNGFREIEEEEKDGLGIVIIITILLIAFAFIYWVCNK